jgi:hypothetical protein
MVDGRDCIRICRSQGGEADQLSALRKLLANNGPRGVTPITERLEDIHRRVQSEVSTLAQAQQMISLTVVTDGLPTSPSCGQSSPADRKVMIETLRTLCTTLPIQLVIRLCTDEESTIGFYNNIDAEVELPLDILDDMNGEAQEVANQGNGWFAYTPELHRIREAGSLCKILDDIDERPLNETEVRHLAELLSGSKQTLAHLDRMQFLKRIGQLVASAPKVYDARRQDLRPILDMRGLRVAMKMTGVQRVWQCILECVS